MRKFAVIFSVLAFACGARASWYWPFESEEDGEEPKRISELMEPASKLIDDASDFASDGKISESVETYRKALLELDRIELENPERAKGTEFATVRNKRAYVNAAIDAMLLSQVKQNARVVAVSDTTELERKLAAEREAKSKPKAEVVQRKETNSVVRIAAAPAAKPPAKPATKREQAIADIASGDYAAAELAIREMLAEKPNGAMALNLKAAMEMKQGRLDQAEKTLDQAITSNPRSYSAYYNMAMLMLQKGAGNKSSAKRYYETGRTVGGPENAELEAMLK